MLEILVNMTTNVRGTVRLLNSIFQIKIFLNFFEIRSSSTLRPWRDVDMISVRPHILTPFMELSIVVVATIRRSMASSHKACRDMTALVATIDPAMETR
jgi:hypothetical protein